MQQPYSALDVLIQRVSCALLDAPAPTGQQLAYIEQAALRAADHHLLQPWRYLVIEGDGLEALGALFLQAKCNENPELPADQQLRARSLPLRAPMIIVAISAPLVDSKIPQVEQLLSAGAAVQNMLNAAFAQGVGAIWRTGDLATNPDVAKGLGLASHETIIGFLYLGTPKGTLKEPPQANCEDFFKTWP